MWRDAKAVIFDCDGTLALTADLHFNAFRDALARQGAEIAREWYDARKGLDRAGLFAAYAAESPHPVDAPRAMAESLALSVARAETTAVENPAVAALARRLAGHMPIAVGSNAETEVVRAILRGAGLDGLFAYIVTVVEAGRAKPEPEIFLLAARHLGVAPGACLVLEDSDEGIRGAEAAGMAVLDVRRAEVLQALAHWHR